MGRRITESQALWIIIVVIIGVDALWARASGIRIDLSLRVALAFCAVSGIHFVYATSRSNRRIEVLAAAGGQLAAFTAAAGILSYLTATSRFPLVDGYLAAGDAAIGFDWLALFKLLQNHPAVDLVLNLAYSSFLPQVFVLLIVLSVAGQFERVREFVWLWVLTLLIIISLSWLMPAEGAWAYYGVAHLVDAYYLPDFFALRSGEMREIVMAKATGIIQFPSFHAAVALIFIYTSRGIRILFPVSVGLNALMISSTPTCGGHHFSDVLAGLVVVPCAIMVLRWRRSARSRQCSTEPLSYDANTTR